MTDTTRTTPIALRCVTTSKDGAPVELKPGDKCRTFRGEMVELVRFDARRVYVIHEGTTDVREYFPGVLCAEVMPAA